VTWQEELSQLDGALATGQISADDYRRERERILAVATGGIQQGPPPGGQGPGQGSPPVNRGSDAFPPPFKWTAERPNQGAGEETTQAVPNASPAESTQIVNASDNTQIVDMKDQASAGPGPSFGDRTQVVSQVPLTSPPHGTPAPWQQQGPPPGGGQQGGWGPQQQQGTPWENQEELVPPWGGGYQAQGAELFDGEPSGGKGKVWAIVGVVVLLLVITGGVLFLTVFKDNGGGTAQQNTEQPQPTKQQPQTPEKPEPFGPLYVPEGTSKGGKTYSAAELEKSKALPTPDLVLIKQAGLTEARSVVVVKDSTTIDLWAFGTNDPPQLADDITADQDRFGYKKVPGEAVDGVEVYTSQQKSASRTVFVYRAHYTNGDNVIRVEAFDPDKAKAKDQFDAALEAQLELTPPQ
jgi:hypothetical protein